MSCVTGTNIVNGGLVFHYDMDNRAKSWKGAPTTNLALYSQGLTNSTWINNTTTVTTSGITPIGLLNNKLSELAGTAKHELTQNFNIDSDVFVTVSAYVKAAERTNCYLRVIGNSKRAAISVNLTNGQFTVTNWANTANTVGSVTQLSNGWWRISITSQSAYPSAPAWWTIGIGMADVTVDATNVAGSGYSYAGVAGNGIYVSGIQIEQSSFVTPYIGTTSAPVSRSNTQSIIDIAKNRTITASSLTYLPDGSFKFTSANSNSIDIENPSGLMSSNITHDVWVNASTLGAWNGIITTMPSWGSGFSLSLGTSRKIAAMVQGDYLSTSWTPSANTWYHIVATHRSSDDYTCLYVNGKLENSFYKAVNYVANTGMSIGCFYTSPKTLFFDGIISQVRVYNRALTADEVQRNFNATRGRYGL